MYWACAWAHWDHQTKQKTENIENDLFYFVVLVHCTLFTVCCIEFFIIQYGFHSSSYFIVDRANRTRPLLALNSGDLTDMSCKRNVLLNFFFNFCYFSLFISHALFTPLLFSLIALIRFIMYYFPLDLSIQLIWLMKTQQFGKIIFNISIAIQLFLLLHKLYLFFSLSHSSDVMVSVFLFI